MLTAVITNKSSSSSSSAVSSPSSPSTSAPLASVIQPDVFVDDDVISAACDGLLVLSARWVKESSVQKMTSSSAAALSSLGGNATSEFALAVLQTRVYLPDPPAAVVDMQRLLRQQDEEDDDGKTQGVPKTVATISSATKSKISSSSAPSSTWHELLPVSLLRFSDCPDRLRLMSDPTVQLDTACLYSETLSAAVAAKPSAASTTQILGSAGLAGQYEVEYHRVEASTIAAAATDADRLVMDEVYAELLSLQRLLHQQKSANDAVRTRMRGSVRYEAELQRQAGLVVHLESGGDEYGLLPFDTEQVMVLEHEYWQLCERDQELRRREKQARRDAGLTDSSASSSSSSESESDVDDDAAVRPLDDQTLLAADADLDVDIIRRMCSVCLEKRSDPNNPVLVCSGCQAACHLGKLTIWNSHSQHFCSRVDFVVLISFYFFVRVLLWLSRLDRSQSGPRSARVAL